MKDRVAMIAQRLVWVRDAAPGVSMVVSRGRVSRVRGAHRKDRGRGLPRPDHGRREAQRGADVDAGEAFGTAHHATTEGCLEAIDRMLVDFPDADVVFVESGGDNLAATFSPELSDLTIYVIDVAAGEKIPRKGGPGITKSDLFVINKTDLAPYVGADLAVMEADTRRMRTNAQGLKPFVMTNLKTNAGLAEVIAFIEQKGMLQPA